MKASDLRIGNIVYNPEQDKNIVVDGGLIATESMREKAINNYKGFEPIPLTEEWLIKFGFEVIDTYLNESIEVLVYGINITNCNNEEKMMCESWSMNFSIGDYNEDDYYVLNHEIKHVHQLQNLYFALTGEELK